MQVNMPCMDGMGYTGCLIGIPGIVYEIIPIQVCSISSTIYRKQPGPLFSLLTCGNTSYCTPTKAAGSSQNWWFLDLGFSKSMRMGKSSKQIFSQMVFYWWFFLWYKENHHLTQVRERIGCWPLKKNKRVSKHPAVVSMHLQLAPVWHGEASSPKQGSKTCLVPARLCRGCDFLSQIPRLSCNFAILWPVKIPLEHIDVWTKAIVRSYHGNTQATCTFRGKFFHPYFRAEKNFILSSFCIVLGAKVWTSSFEPRTQVA